MFSGSLSMNILPARAIVPRMITRHRFLGTNGTLRCSGPIRALSSVKKPWIARTNSLNNFQLEAQSKVLRRNIRNYPTNGGGGRQPTSFIDAANRIPPTAVVVGILLINGVVFVMWQGAKGQAREGDWSQLKWMTQTFTTSGDNLRAGRLWVLLTSCFSHESLSHLLFNSFTFFFVGGPTIGILGNMRFLALYLGGGVTGNVLSYLWHQSSGQAAYSSHGASGAIYAVLSFFACVAPKTMFYLYGIIPIPAWAIVPGVLAWDIWNSLDTRGGRTDHAGHVGGILAGALYYLAL